MHTNPTIADSYTSCGTGTGIYTCQLRDLTPNTTYYLRAYAKNRAGYSYGDFYGGVYQIQFSTTEIAENKKDDQIVIYPNPNKGSCTITISHELLNANYQILSPTGALLQSGVFKSQKNELNLPETKGIYFLKICGKALIINRKIIVE